MIDRIPLYYVARFANRLANFGCAVIVGLMLGVGIIGLMLTLLFGSFIIQVWR